MSHELGSNADPRENSPATTDQKPIQYNEDLQRTRDSLELSHTRPATQSMSAVSAPYRTPANKTAVFGIMAVAGLVSLILSLVGGVKGNDYALSGALIAAALILVSGWFFKHEDRAKKGLQPHLHRHWFIISGIAFVLLVLSVVASPYVFGPGSEDNDPTPTTTPQQEAPARETATSLSLPAPNDPALPAPPEQGVPSADNPVQLEVPAAPYDPNTNLGVDGGEVDPGYDPNQGIPAPPAEVEIFDSAGVADDIVSYDALGPALD